MRWEHAQSPNLTGPECASAGGSKTERGQLRNLIWNAPYECISPAAAFGFRCFRPSYVCPFAEDRLIVRRWSADGHRRGRHGRCAFDIANRELVLAATVL